MSLSFTMSREPLAGRWRKRRRVLVTGANGHIGSYFASQAHRKYELVLMVREEAEGAPLSRFGTVVLEQLNDLEGLTRICAGVDTVVHLAAAASPSSTWSTILQANILGTYNLMVAAKAAGVRRVIYASSIHAVSGYPRDVQVKTTDPPNPGDLYGVSKVFGEALGRYMAEQEGMSVIALRIGGFQPVKSAEGETGVKMLDAWISQRDLQQLMEKCIEDERLRFAIFNGVSNNRFKRLDISDARELVGYSPEDDTTEENPRLRPLHLGREVIAHNESDGASGYESGIREELSRALKMASRGGRGGNGARRTHRKESAMAGGTSKKRAGTSSRGSLKGEPANPADFGKKTTPVRERLAREVKEMPPEERLKRGR